MSSVNKVILIGNLGKDPETGLDEIIEARRAKAIEYEEYLKRRLEEIRKSNPK